jgi:predicted nucleotide-binding protein
MITEEQKIWIEEAYQKQKNSQPINSRILKIELEGKIPFAFDSEQIPAIFYKNNHVTLLGVYLIDFDAEIIQKTNLVLESIKQILKSPPHIHQIPIYDIHNMTKLNINEVEVIIKELSIIDLFKSIKTSEGFRGWTNIKIDGSTVENFLIFDSVEKIYIEVSKTMEKMPDEVIANLENMKSNMESNKRKVFVVHGRNWEAKKALFNFLRAIGLQPMEWSETVKATGKASPYIGEILDIAFSTAQAVIVLLTPDDEARLCAEFCNDDDEHHEINLTRQARPNVLFEAGMAIGRNQDRTILVELGKLRPFSDIGGRHVIRLNGSTERRQELAERLEIAGCEVNLRGTDWHTTGDFNSIIQDLKKKLLA